MKRIALLALLLSPFAHATNYCVSKTGVDTDTGINPGHCWLTAAKVNAVSVANAFGPLDVVTFIGPGRWAEEGDIINATVPTSTTTTPSQLPQSGSSAGQITFTATNGAIIDAADIFTATWTSDGGGMYHTTLTTQPLKLYSDDNDQDGPQLMPQLNARGQYSSAATYNQYDLVNYGVLSSVSTTTAGSGMTVGTYALSFSGGGGTGAAGTYTVTSATTGSASLSNIGNLYTSAPTVTVVTGGTPPVLTANVFQNQDMLSPNQFSITSSPGQFGSYPWTPVSNSIVPNDSQAFSSTNTGVQNVAATPGSWYVSGSGSSWLVYVHLLDGTSPAGHVMKATHRNYGFYLQSVSYITISNFVIEHAFLANVYAVGEADSSLGGNYWTGEYNQIVGNTIFNGGNVGSFHDVFNSAYPTRFNAIGGNILVRPGVESNPHFLRYTMPMVNSNTVGTVDNYYGLRGSANSNYAGITVEGTDDGGTMAPLIWNNTVSVTNTKGITWTAAALYGSNHGNLGGRFAYNTCTNSILCYDISATGPLQIDHNFNHDFRGQGIQTGGSASISTPSQPWLIHQNIFANFGPAPSTVGFNAIDCNGAIQGSFGLYEFNNTFYNVADAGLDYESGCGGSVVWNNITDNNALISMSGANTWLPPGNGKNGTNGSSYVGISGSNPQVGVNWHDNHYFAACTGAQSTWTPGCAGAKFSGVASCSSTAGAGWKGFWPETGITYCEDKDPLFVNVSGGTTTANDFRLQAGSPDRGVGSIVTMNGVSSTSDLGAVPYGTGTSTQPFIAPPLVSSYGVAF